MHPLCRYLVEGKLGRGIPMSSFIDRVPYFSYSTKTPYCIAAVSYIYSHKLLICHIWCCSRRNWFGYNFYKVEGFVGVFVVGWGVGGKGGCCVERLSDDAIRQEISHVTL